MNHVAGTKILLDKMINNTNNLGSLDTQKKQNFQENLMIIKDEYTRSLIE